MSRNFDIQSLEERVYNMDNSEIRNYDIFSIEKRIYDLEQNGGGSGSVKISTGTFTSASTAHDTVEIETEFKPDLILVALPFTNNDTVSYWWSELSYAETKAIWSLAPSENVNYAVDLDRVTGETGICTITDTGFTFMSNGANTLNVECKYIAIKYTEDE